VAQLAFRNARKSLLGVKLQVRHLLHIPEVFAPSHGAPRTSSFDAASDSLVLDPAIRELDDVISVYLRKTVDRFDLTRNYEVLRRGRLGSPVVSMLNSGAEGPGFKSQPRRCRVTVFRKLFTPVVPLFTKQRNWQQPS